MAAAPGPMTDADVVSTMCRILAHAPDAADAPAPVNIPHRLLRDVRPFSRLFYDADEGYNFCRISLFIAGCPQILAA
jgi:hypothetical protein